MMPDLPEGVTPEVQPLYGPTGEIYRYTLRSDRRSVRDLKTIQDWVIERNLRSVSGVADIVSFGGEVKTFEVSVNPHQLINYGITSLERVERLPPAVFIIPVSRATVSSLLKHGTLYD